MAKDEKQIYEDILRSWKTPEMKSSEESWNELQSKLKKEETPVRSIAPVRRWVGIAASVAVVLTFLWWNGRQQGAEMELSSLTEMITHELPDGSIAYLNAGSSMSYSPDEWDENRSLELTGEAYFDVEKGSQFTVQTNHGDVTVLGTEFNVFSRAEGFEVRCYEGKVRVEAAGDEEVLTPGMKSAMNDDGLMASEFGNMKDHWKDGTFSWESANLGDVFKEVERHYSVKIDAGKNSSKVYTGSFAKLELDDVLSLICEPMGLVYKKDSNGMIKIEALASAD